MRKFLVVAALAAVVALSWFSDAFAANKKSNPSDNGQANGVAHRVAALEAKVAALEDAQDDTDAVINQLLLTVADHEVRISELEAAAVPAP